jgi:hypothetical protein
LIVFFIRVCPSIHGQQMIEKFCGVTNIDSGKKVYHKNIAKLPNIKNKKLIFIDNNKKTNHIANISKIKGIECCCMTQCLK